MKKMMKDHLSLKTEEALAL